MPVSSSFCEDGAQKRRTGFIISSRGDTVNVRNCHIAATSPCRAAAGTVCSCTCRRCRLIKSISHRRRRKPPKSHQSPASLAVSCCQPGLPGSSLHSPLSSSSNYLQERTFKSPLFFFTRPSSAAVRSQVLLFREREKKRMGALGHISYCKRQNTRVKCQGDFPVSRTEDQKRLTASVSMH